MDILFKKELEKLAEVNVEIIGKNLHKYFQHDPDSIAQCTYDGEIEVWDVCESMFGYMIEQSAEDFFEEAGTDAWWRQADGSILGKPSDKAIVNGHEIMLWHLDERDLYDTYDNILDYIYHHVGASSPKNVCAILVDLARFNNMTVGELCKKYLSPNN